MSDYERWFEYAPQAYEQIRRSTNDIPKIAENIGWPEHRIQKIKDHVFNKNHKLRDGTFGKFDPDPDIADAWGRLTSGSYRMEDVNLLNHELYESWAEGLYKFDYDKAHSWTIDKAKKPWNP
ncbi:hypothetical protein [Thermoactinomyces sp. DSM 45891]|uniref:hypothetical protein n=1 Tax=Thermoactinomyces sp. DSM 45891 TaxID=1761907 RepID=UPI0009308EF1|nr:hypothetical protein [Thermoactinomyces sp. DSM 45891]